MSEQTTTAWLVREEEVLATIMVVSGWKSAAAGAWVPDGASGPVLVRPAFWAQSVRSSDPLDVALLDSENIVVRTLRLKRNRVAMPAFSARSVLRAKRGTFGTWDLKIGDIMDIRPCE